jgi:hypothetical protein
VRCLCYRLPRCVLGQCTHHLRLTHLQALRLPICEGSKAASHKAAWENNSRTGWARWEYCDGNLSRHECDIPSFSTIPPGKCLSNKIYSERYVPPVSVPRPSRLNSRRLFKEAAIYRHNLMSPVRYIVIGHLASKRQRVAEADPEARATAARSLLLPWLPAGRSGAGGRGDLLVAMCVVILPYHVLRSIPFLWCTIAHDESLFFRDTSLACCFRSL